MDKPPPPPPLPDDLVAELETLADVLARRPDHADIARKFEWLVDALVFRGQIPAELAKRLNRIRADRSTVRLTIVDDKRAKESPDIDCASRVHLCQARCCRFEVSLSAEDLRDGLPYSLEQPFQLPRDPQTKKCVCMDAAGACTVYETRPASCRVYDCRGDPRVWIDFEARIPAPMQERLKGSEDPEGV